LFSGRFVLFYEVPKVKFTLHLIAHLAYMFYLAFILLGQYDQAHPVISSHEYFFWAWSFARAVGELSELEDFDDLSSFRRSIRLYIIDVWNQFDALVILLVVAIMGLRLSYAPSSDDPIDVYSKPPDPSGATLLYNGMEHSWVRTLYAFLVILVFMRVLQFLRYFSSVGVLTICVGGMMTDVTLFIILLGPLTLGFAVANAALTPRETQEGTTMTDDWYAILGFQPLWEPFWGLIGSFDYKTPLTAIHEYGTDYPTGVTMPLLVFAYQFIATIILVNLLIAQMADTYGRITSEGFLRWQFERAQLISEYKDTKKPLPPPLNVVYSVLSKLVGILRPDKEERKHDGFKYIPMEIELRKWQRKELSAVKACLAARELREHDTVEAKMSRLEELMLKQEETSRRKFEDVMRKLERLIIRDSAHPARPQDITHIETPRTQQIT